MLRLCLPLLLIVLFSRGLNANWNLGSGGFYSIRRMKKSQNKNTDHDLHLLSSGYSILGLELKPQVSELSGEFHFQWVHFTNSKKKNLIFLGKNNYVGFQVSSFQIWAGRKLDQSVAARKLQWSDGTEGLGFSVRLDKSWNLNVGLLDFYRSYPLWKKYVVSNPPSEWKLAPGNRYRFRHSVSLQRKKKNTTWEFSFRYMNLGNWGATSHDEYPHKLLGDRDYLYQLETGFSWENDQAGFTGQFRLERGMDRATKSKVRKDKTYVFNGELLWILGWYRWKMFRWEFLGFLPSPDTRSQNGNLQEYGYVGWGANPIQNFVLVQILDYRPSGWITSYGLQKNPQLRYGRQNSAWVRAQWILEFWGLAGGLSVSSFSPYKTGISMKAHFHTNRRLFSSSNILAYSVFCQNEKSTSKFRIRFQASLVKRAGTKNALGYGMILSLGYRF